MSSSSAPLRLALGALVALLAVAAVLVRAGGTDVVSDLGAAVGPAARASPPGPPPYATGRAMVHVNVRFKHPPRSGLLFDLRSGRVLWSRMPARRQPVASLAKMMTAIVVADRARPSERVLITRQALAEDGSKVGLLAPLRRMRLETLLYGLLLPSGNDAAVALAQHVGGSVPGFVGDMNAQARALGLHCTHFSSPDGLEDRGNGSCARDLAVIAREVLARPRLARIVARRQAVLPALVPRTVKRKGKGKGTRVTIWRPGRLYLYNNNPLLRTEFPGTTGVKTGYTDAAGRCLVATVHRGATTLGVVLLHSPYPGDQATRLLDRGFAAIRSARRARARATASARASG